MTRRRSTASSAAGSTVLAYTRVSTDEQGISGAGLGAQHLVLEAEAARRGWADVEWVEDVGYSGKNLKRPGIEGALERLAAGEAGVLVVSKLDRLSRSIVDTAGLMERSRREGWTLIALDVDVDTSTPAGELLANIVATVNQFERRVISQRTKDALAVKRAQGVVLGRPRTLPAEVAERIAAERAGGATFTAIAAGLNRDGVATAQGGAKWWPMTVKQVLDSRAAA